MPGARLEPWDWAFYAERVRKERYSLDDALLRPYLELDRVLRDGVFRAAGSLYGLTFTERHRPGRLPPGRARLGGLRRARRPSRSACSSGDFYTRASKRGGAWMNNLVDQSALLGERPVVVNNLNIGKPPAGEPTLLAWDEVITLFHEFGHALHGLFSRRALPVAVRHRRAAGLRRVPVAGQRDVGLAPGDPAVVRGAPRHRRAGARRSGSTRCSPSRQFNEGFSTTEYLAAALLDQAWYQLAPEDVPTDPDDVEAFEAAALERAGVAFAAGAAAVPHDATSTTSSAAATRPATTPTSGRRCSTPTPWSGSPRTAA